MRCKRLLRVLLSSPDIVEYVWHLTTCVPRRLFSELLQKTLAVRTVLDAYPIGKDVLVFERTMWKLKETPQRFRSLWNMRCIYIGYKHRHLEYFGVHRIKYELGCV